MDLETIVREMEEKNEENGPRDKRTNKKDDIGSEGIMTREWSLKTKGFDLGRNEHTNIWEHNTQGLTMTRQIKRECIMSCKTSSISTKKLPNKLADHPQWSNYSIRQSYPTIMPSWQYQSVKFQSPPSRDV